MAVGTSVVVAVVVKSSANIDEDSADDEDAVSCCVRGRDGANANAWHGVVDHESMAAKTAAATVFFMFVRGMYVLVIILNYVP